jgi:hypothetical protein
MPNQPPKRRYIHFLQTMESVQIRAFQRQSMNFESVINIKLFAEVNIVNNVTVHTPEDKLFI